MKKQVMACAVFLMVVTAASGSFAAGKVAGGKRFGGGLWGEGMRFGVFSICLDLTKTQEERIKQVVREESEELEVIIGMLKDGRKRLLLQSKNSGFDEGQVRAIAREQADLLEDLIVIKSRIRARVAGELTPAQKEKAFKLMKRGRNFEGNDI